MKKPGRRYAYLLIGVAMLFYLYEIFLQVSPSVMMPELMQQFHLDALAFGSMAATYFYIYTAMQLPVGVLYDRFGVRWIIIISLGVCVLGALIFSLAVNLPMLYLGRFCMGLGSAFALIGVLKIASNFLPSSQLSFFIGTTMTLGMAGAMLGNLLLTRLVHYTTWNHAMFFTFIVGLIILAALFICLLRFKEIKHLAKHKRSRFNVLLAHFLSTISRPVIWLNALVALLLYIPVGVFAILWGIPFLNQGLDFSPQVASVINSMLFLGYAIGAPLIGACSELVCNRKRFLYGSSLVGLLALMFVIYSTGLSAFIVGALFFIIGFCVGSQTLCFVMAKELSSHAIAATSFAFTNLVVCIGVSALQPTIGAILDSQWHGTMTQLHTQLFSHAAYKLALLIIPISYLLAFFIVFLLPETGRDHSRS